MPRARAKKPVFRLEYVDPATLVANDWNPNVQSESIYLKELASIKEFGFAVPIIVRVGEKGKYEIIDGEHRWRAARDLLLPEVPVYNLGPVSREKAMEMTVAFNEIRGVADPLKLGGLFRELVQTIDVEELATFLPFSVDEIDRLITTTDLDSRPGEGLPDIPPYEPRTAYGCDLTPDQLEAVRAVTELILGHPPGSDAERGDAIATMATRWL